jgi:hypothetical protein
LSEEKKLEYLDKQRKSRQKKKDELKGATLLSYYLQPGVMFSGIIIYFSVILAAGEQSPLDDLTNLPINENREKHGRSGSSWYSRLSPGKKAEYLDKQRAARKLKRIAAVNLENLYEPKQLDDQGKQYYFL